MTCNCNRHTVSPRMMMMLQNCVRMKCGSLEFYDKQYDRVTTKNEKRLQRISRIFHKVTTTDDPVIRQVGSQCQCLDVKNVLSLDIDIHILQERVISRCHFPVVLE